MSAQNLSFQRETFLRRHAVGIYFTLTYAISWMGAFIVAAPYLFRREPVPKMTGLLIPGYASWSKFGWRRLDLGHGRKGRCKGPFFFDCAAFEFPHAGMERCLFPPV